MENDTIAAGIIFLMMLIVIMMLAYTALKYMRDATESENQLLKAKRNQIQGVSPFTNEELDKVVEMDSAFIRRLRAKHNMSDTEISNKFGKNLIPPYFVTPGTLRKVD